MQDLKDIKMIATDMDGTFVGEGVFELSPEDFELIRKLREKGIVFAVATGRGYGNTRRLFAPVADDILYICDNGCNVMWQGKNLFLCPMDRSVCSDLTDYILSLPPEYENVMCTADCYALMPKSSEEAIRIARDWKMTIRVVNGMEEIGDEVIKHSVFHRGGIPEEFKEEMEKRWGDRVKHINCSTSEWLDLQDGDKGIALQKAAEALGIELKNVAAFGDNTNDIEMLDIAGFSFAMSHAHAEAKAHAKYTCSDVRDVLREILACHS